MSKNVKKATHRNSNNVVSTQRNKIHKKRHRHTTREELERRWKAEEKRRRLDDIGMYGILICMLIMATILTVHVLRTDERHAPVEVTFNAPVTIYTGDKEWFKRQEGQPYIIASTVSEAQAEEQVPTTISSAEDEDDEQKTEEEEISQAPEVQEYGRYDTISQFQDIEILELQKLAVAEGGFTENAMQACAFSAIQTAREEKKDISSTIRSGKYSCVKGGKITINGRDVIK